MSQEPIEKGVTERKFSFWNFTDKFGHSCSLQKSSCMAEAGNEAVWFGVDNDGEFQILPHGTEAQDKHGFGWQEKNLKELYPNCSVLVSSRMHLTQNMVKMLLPALTHFAKTGELPE